MEARVAQVRDTNVAAYLRANPGLTSPATQHPTPSVTTPVTIMTTATSPHASKVFEQRQPYLQLFAAAIGTDAHTGESVVIPMEFTKSYASLFEVASAVDRDALYRSHLRALAAKHQASPFALESMVTLPKFSTVACRLLLRMAWKETTLGEDVSSLGQELSIYNFLAPPLDLHSP